MRLIQLAVPAALLAWFLWRARANRLFVFGIPILMVMGSSVFFDQMRPFWVPGRFSPQTHIMGWLIVAWAVAILTSRPTSGIPRVGIFGAPRLLPEELAFLLIAVLLALHTLAVFSSTGDLGAAVTTASGLFYILMGYLLVRGIASRFSRSQTIEFLSAVVIANTVAAALYVAHQGLHLPIYPAAEYFTTVFHGQTITRTFTFAPQFSVLALGFVLARRAWTPGWLVVLTITVLSIVVSYTRTLLVAAAIAVLVAIIVRELKKPHIGRLLRRVLTIALSVAGALVLFSVVRPVEYHFVLSRLGEFTSAGGPTDVGNWDIRRLHFLAVQRVVGHADQLFGLGFPAPGSNAVDAHLHLWTSDMAWVPILYRLGWVGIVLFALVFAGFAARSLSLALQDPEERRYLGLVYLIAIVLTIVLSFVSWTFMEERVYAMGLWLLAFVAAEALRPRAERHGAEASPPDAVEPPPQPG
jgi:hypothetical protein